MPTYHFDHIHLNSPDAVKTAQFYENMFGAKIVRIRPRPEGSSVRLDLNGEVAMIGPPVGSPPLVPATLQPQYGLIHFGLRTDDLEKAVIELKAKGMVFGDHADAFRFEDIIFCGAGECFSRVAAILAGRSYGEK